MNNIKKSKKKGFTLIELIIVIAIIAILAAVAIPKFGEVRKNANEKSDIANAKTIANAATALIAEGEVVAPAQGKKKVLIISTADKNAEAGKIEGYIQSMPIPKSVTGTFIVVIDENGGVVVNAGGTADTTAGTITGGINFFPQ